LGGERHFFANVGPWQRKRFTLFLWKRIILYKKSLQNNPIKYPSAGDASLAPKLWLKASLVFGLVMGETNLVPKKDRTLSVVPTTVKVAPQDTKMASFFCMDLTNSGFLLCRL